jgi:hypothetical protein
MNIKIFPSGESTNERGKHLEQWKSRKFSSPSAADAYATSSDFELFLTAAHNSDVFPLKRNRKMKISQPTLGQL